ncbi:maleylpyruvate isomerase N-terminal domain-containing protein [Actinocorallia populi]|uniref:maleylpyruvate isomerase N-terminal domain-containing protein n=1 Tax=Actinocorallia populi TaxID=2079200 RepID=UPI0022B7E6A6|nr:maleylpyruvate isomerase N-terminal domain-containing protein [Actinocorallia populi]
MKTAQKSMIQAFHDEAWKLEDVLTTFTPAEWDLPTPCEPWTVRDLVGHLTVVISWLPAMLTDPAPSRAEVSAAAYYRPDDRFSPQTDQARVALARAKAAAHATPPDLVEDFAATWRLAHALCAAEPAPRVVRTRHGDAMLLADFLLTRLVELTLHGLDLAAALARTPWPTPHAARAVEHLLLGGASRPDGWDRATFLRKATGRLPLTPAETRALTDRNITWLALG